MHKIVRIVPKQNVRLTSLQRNYANNFMKRNMVNALIVSIVCIIHMALTMK